MRSGRRCIAVTGATGFIGGSLVRKLASAGWRVRALIRPGSDRKKIDGIAAEWITGRLEDITSLRRLVDGADVVVNCAGVVRGARQTDFDSVNVDGAARLVCSAAERRPRPRFLLVSSLAAREPGLSHYAASKRRGEAKLASLSGGMPWDIVRPPAVYGPEDREIRPILQWMAGSCIAPVIGRSENRLSLLYVTDLVEAMIRLIERSMSCRGIYEPHDGHDRGYAWQDIIDAVMRLTGRPIIRVKVPHAVLKLAASLNMTAARLRRSAPMLTPGKVRELNHPDWVGDNTPLTAAAGWTPKVDLAEGLRRTLPKNTRKTFKTMGALF